MEYTPLDSYREPLCVADNKGYPLFSPLCNPDLRVPSQPIIIQKEKRPAHFVVSDDCYVAPVQPPNPQVEQFDDRVSAHNWFKDPTYYQRTQLRKRGINDAAVDDNPSLIQYHQIKTMEKVAGLLFQTL